MKNIFILITLILLTSCTWKYQESVTKDTEVVETKSLEELKIEKEKAEEILKQIKEDEDKVMSKVLESFLTSEEIDIQKELLNTQNRYNDLLGPILEYEHEKVESQSGSTSSGATSSGTTLSGSVLTDEEKTDLDNLFNTNTGSVYSGEVKILDIEDQIISFPSNLKNIVEVEIITEEKNTEIIPEYEHETKVGNSGTYKSYMGVADICKGGLKMIKKDGSETWLFLNSCSKMIYDFKLDIGGINVYYKNENGKQNIEFVTIN